MDRVASFFFRALAAFLAGAALVLWLGSCSTLDGVARNLTAPASFPTAENPNPPSVIQKAAHDATAGTPAEPIATLLALIANGVLTTYNTVRGEQAHKKIAAAKKANGNGNGNGAG